ncbi:hypothetical protein Droror1_Dr00007516 [Drosera rotundifolia]
MLKPGEESSRSMSSLPGGDKASLGYCSRELNLITSPYILPKSPTASLNLPKSPMVSPTRVERALAICSRLAQPLPNLTGLKKNHGVAALDHVTARGIQLQSYFSSAYIV